MNMNINTEAEVLGDVYWRQRMWPSSEEVRWSRHDALEALLRKWEKRLGKGHWRRFDPCLMSTVIFYFYFNFIYLFFF